MPLFIPARWSFFFTLTARPSIDSPQFVHSNHRSRDPARTSGGA
jgi:hypothetical protein